MYQRILTPRPTPKNRVEERMAGGARQTIKIDLLVQGIQQNAVLENQGRVTKIQDLVYTLKTQYRTEYVIADLSKTGVFNTFSEEPKKTFQKLGKIEVFELGDVFFENTVPCVRQVLARRTVIWHLRNMFQAFQRTEAQNKGSLGNLVNSSLCGKEDLFARCKAWTVPVVVRSLQSE